MLTKNVNKKMLIKNVNIKMVHWFHGQQTANPYTTHGLWHLALVNRTRDKAESYFKSLGCNYATGPISWDDKNLMAQLHMAKLFPSNVDYRSKVEEEADKLLTHHRTPKGPGL